MKRVALVATMTLLLGCSVLKKQSAAPPDESDDKFDRLLDMQQQQQQVMAEQTEALKDLKTSMLTTRGKFDSAPEKIAEEVANKMGAHQSTDPRLDELASLAKDMREVLGDLKKTPPSAPGPGPDFRALADKKPWVAPVNDSDKKVLITIYSPKWCRGRDCQQMREETARGSDMFEYQVMSEEPFPDGVIDIARKTGYPLVLWEDPRGGRHYYDRSLRGTEFNWPGEEELAKAYGRTVAGVDRDAELWTPTERGKLGALMRSRVMYARSAKEAGARMQYRWHRAGGDEDLAEHMIRVHGFASDELEGRDPQELISMHDATCRTERRALGVPQQAARVEPRVSVPMQYDSSWSIQQLQFQQQGGCGPGMRCGPDGRCYPQ